MSIIKPFFNKNTRGVGIFFVLLIMTIISCPSADSDSGSSSSSGGGSDDSVPPLVAVSVELIAGGSAIGKVDGKEDAAKFNYPSGMAVDTDGTIYVADEVNHIIRKISPDGTVSTYAGSGTAGSTNATGTAASFNMPTDVLFKDANTLYVLDNKGVRQIEKNSALVSTFADNSKSTSGSTNGTYFRSIMRDTNINTDIFYIINPQDDGATNHDNIVVEYKNGDFTRLIFVDNYTYNDALNVAHEFADAAFDSNGNMYVSTGAGNAIITFNPTTAARFPAGSKRTTSNNVEVDISGLIQEIAFFVGPPSRVSGYVDGVGTAARFNEINGMLIKGDYIYVVDSENHVIRMVQISTKTVSTLVGIQGTKGQQDGVKDVATFTSPEDIEFAPNGDIIVSENHAIRRIVVQK